jgi:hypothetical protein
MSVRNEQEKNLAATFALIILLFTQISFSQADATNRAVLPLQREAKQGGHFIVAFELSPENGFDFTWPFESMQPAPNEAVVMVIEKMPRARNDGGSKKYEPLNAARDLKINGRRQKPYRTAKKQTYFLVKLDQGRLRLSLSIPAGMSLDAEHKSARIKLYKH